MESALVYLDKVYKKPVKCNCGFETTSADEWHWHSVGANHAEHFQPPFVRRFTALHNKNVPIIADKVYQPL